MTASTTSPCISRETPGGLLQIEHRIALAAQVHALEPARQKPGRPLARGDRLVLPALAERSEHHEAGQILGLAAEAVGDPRAHARPAGDLRAGVHEHVRRIVIDRVGVIERMMQMSSSTEPMCGNSSQISAPHLPNFLKLHCGPKHFSCCPCSCASCWPLVNDFGHRLAVQLGELRLVIERLQVRRAAGHGQPDDALRLRWEMRLVRSPRATIRCCAAKSEGSSNELSAREPRLAFARNARREIQVGTVFIVSCPG